MSDEITQPPAVAEEPTAIEPIPGSVQIMPASVVEDPHDGNVPWNELSDSQKLDILHMKVDSIGAQVAWIGQTFQGVINMVGKVSPMDLFKMMRGGK
jgi:hypothetical protein